MGVRLGQGPAEADRQAGKQAGAEAPSFTRSEEWAFPSFPFIVPA